jgi:hypothetical protein
MNALSKPLMIVLTAQLTRLVLACGLSAITLIATAITTATFANASDNCDMDLNYDLQISTEALLVSQADVEVYKISEGGQLSVKSAPVELTAQQRTVAEAYAGDVAALTVQWIELVSAVLEYAKGPVTIALRDALGEDSAVVIETTRSLELAGQKFERVTQPEPGVYRISATEFEELGESLGEEIGAAIETAVKGMVDELETNMEAGNAGFLKTMATFAMRMKRLGDELEHSSQFLQQNSAALCEEMKRLKESERQMQKQIPQLADYDLLD